MSHAYPSDHLETLRKAPKNRKRTGGLQFDEDSDVYPYYDRNYPVPAKICYFYSDGNQFSLPRRIPIPWDRYRNINSLLHELTYKMTDLRSGVRAIFTPRGRHRITNIEQFKDEGEYVCTDSRKRAKGVDVFDIRPPQQWHGGRPPSAQRRHNEILRSADRLNRRRVKVPGYQSRSHPTSNSSQMSNSDSRSYPPSRPYRPPQLRRNDCKRVMVFLNGDPYKRHVIKLDKRHPDMDHVLQDVSAAFNRSVKKIFDVTGAPMDNFTEMYASPDAFVATCGENFRKAPYDKAFGGPSRKPPRRLPHLAPLRRQPDRKYAAASKSKGRWYVTILTRDEQPMINMTALAFLSVYGREGHVDNIPLSLPLNADSIVDTFQPGQVDEFEVNTGKIGALTKIRVSHDNNGLSPHWFLGTVHLKDFDTQELFEFHFNRWLSRDYDDCEISRELPVVRPGQKVPPVVRYQLHVYTGDCWNAGTAAHVFVTLYGDQGDTGVRQLYKPLVNKGRVFQKGDVDTFELEAVHLGRLRRLIIGHDCRIPGEGWYLDYVIIRESDKANAKEFLFPCSRWLDEGEDDGKTTRELRVTEEYAHDLLEKEMWEYEKWKYEMENELQFYNKLTGKLMRITSDSTVDVLGEESDIHTRLHCLPKAGTNIVLRSVVIPRFHVSLDGGLLSGQGRGTADCELAVRLQPDRSVMLESVGSPHQFLNFSEEGHQADVRLGGSAPSPGKLFTVHCRGAFRDGGIVMFCTSLTQTLTLDHENGIHGTGKRNRMAHFRVHKMNELSVFMFESVVFSGQYLRISEGRSDCRGTGDRACYFIVLKHKDMGFVTLEAYESRGIFIGMTPDGRIRPTVNTGQNNVQLFPEVIKFGIAKYTGRSMTPRAPSIELSEKQDTARSEQKTEEKEDVKPPVTPTAEDWKVSVRSAQTAENGEVVLYVYGNGDPSGPEVLGRAEVDSDLFRAGSVDEFDIKLHAMGDVFKIRLEMQPLPDLKAKASWNVDWVKLDHLLTKKSYKFDFGGKYLCRDYDDMELSRELAVSPDDPLVHYEVMVVTGSVPGSETGSNVFVRLHGSHGDSGNRMVFTGDDKVLFERGREDTFRIEAVHLGELHRCVVSIDGKLPGQGWYCEHIQVRDPLEGRTYYFPCKGWLDAGMGDKQIQRVLIAEGYIIYEEKSTEDDLDSLKAESEEDEDLNQLHEYEQHAADAKNLISQITDQAAKRLEEYHASGIHQKNDGRWALQVQTGSQAGMGSDNDVLLVVYGDMGHSDALLIKSASEKGRFAAGSLEEVPLQADLSSLGKLYKVRLGQTDVNAMSGWFVESIILRNIDKPDEFYKLTINRWMSRTRDDYDVWREVPLGDFLYPVLVYTVEVETISRPSQRASSTAFVQLFGTRGDSGRRLLYKSRNNDEKFLEGQSDTFPVEAVSLDDVTKLAIGHEDRTHGDPNWKWNIRRITVTTVETGEQRRWRFIVPPGHLLAPDVFRLELEASTGEVEEREDSKTFTFLLETGADSDGDPDGDPGRLYATVVGDKGSTGEIWLNSRSDNRGQFAPDTEDTFTITVPEDVGRLLKVRLNVGAAVEWKRWHLQSMVLSASGKQHIFNVDKRLGRGKDAVTALELPCENEDGEEEEVHDYEVTVHVGQRYGAESDAEAFITIFGDGGDTGKRWLLHDKEANSLGCYVAGQSRTFRVEAVNLGQLTHLVFGHTARGPGAGLFLDRVTVRDLSSQTGYLEYVFPCGQWLDSAVPGAPLEQELMLRDVLDHEKEAQRATATARFIGDRLTLTVRTSKESPASFHGPAFFTGFGRSGATERQMLLKSHSSDYQPGQVVSYELEVETVGELTKFHLDIDEDEESWICQSVSLNDVETGAVFHHFSPTFFGSGNNLHEYSLLGQVRVRYLVYFSPAPPSTSPHRHWVCLTGQGGLESGWRPISGGCKEIEVETSDLVLVEKVKIKTDSHDDPWTVENVIVRAGLMALHETTFENVDERPLEKAAPLTLSGSGTATVPSKIASGRRWSVFLYTDVQSSFTPVEIVLTGTISQSTPRTLSPFSASSRHEFSLDSGEIGALTKVTLALLPDPESSSSSSWHLQKLRLEETLSGLSFLFPADRELKVGQPLELAAAWPDTPAPQLLSFQVSVTQGRWVDDAGLDIDCRLIGNTGESPWRRLSRGRSGANGDSFEVMCLDIGELREVEIGHDRRGWGQGAYVETVTVSYYSNGVVTKHFPCNRWLDTSWGDGQVQVRLRTTESQENAKLIKYDIKLHSEETHILASADFSVQLVGDEGKTARASTLIPVSSLENQFCKYMTQSDFLHVIEKGTLYTSSNEKIRIDKIAIKKSFFGPALYEAMVYSEINDGSLPFSVSRTTLQPVTDNENLEGNFGSKWTMEANIRSNISAMPVVTFCSGLWESEPVKGSRGSDELKYSFDVDMSRFKDITKVRLKLEASANPKSWIVTQLKFMDETSGATFSVRLDQLSSEAWVECPVVWPGRLTPSTRRYIVGLKFGSEGLSKRQLSLKIVGSNGTSGLRSLMTDAAANENYQFAMDAIDLGNVSSVEVDVEKEEKDEEDLGPHLHEVVIDAEGQETVFPCDKWLSEKRSGLSVTLWPSNFSHTASS